MRSSHTVSPECAPPMSPENSPGGSEPPSLVCSPVFSDAGRPTPNGAKVQVLPQTAVAKPESPLAERKSAREPPEPSERHTSNKRRPSVVSNTDDDMFDESRRRRSSIGVSQIPIISFINTKSDYNTVDQFVQDPIACGFFRAFCMKEHNEENLFFWLDVDHYKDLYFQGIASHEEILEHARSIMTTYIGTEATLEICIPHKLEKKMMEIRERLQNDEVNQDIFEQCQQFALITMTQDVYPRFSRSEQLKEFKARVDGMCPSVIPRPPKESLVSHLVEEKKTTPTNFSLDEVMEDRILFPIFLRSLRKQSCLENLYCYIQVKEFEEAMENSDVKLAKELAWSIFCNFLNEGSPYQVEYTSRILCKSVARTLPTPQPEMFRVLKEKAKEALENDYGRFRKSADSQKLHVQMEEERSALAQTKRVSLKSLSTFSLRSKTKIAVKKQA